MSHDYLWIGAGLLLSLIVFGLIQWMLYRRHAQLRQIVKRQMPELLELFSQSLIGGADLNTALGVVADLGVSPGNCEFAKCRDEIAAGVPAALALTHLRDVSSDFTINYLTTLLETSPNDTERIRQAWTRLEILNRHAELVTAEIDQSLGAVQGTSLIVFMLVPLASIALLFLSPAYGNNIENHLSAQILLSVGMLLYVFGGLWLFSLWGRQKRIREIWH